MYFYPHIKNKKGIIDALIHRHNVYLKEKHEKMNTTLVIMAAGMGSRFGGLKQAQAVTEDAYASKTRLTISVRVKYTDTRNDANSVDQTFSAYRDFSATELLIDVQDQLCQEISKELVELIFNATLGNW